MITWLCVEDELFTPYFYLFLATFYSLFITPYSLFFYHCLFFIAVAWKCVVVNEFTELTESFLWLVMSSRAKENLLSVSIQLEKNNKTCRDLKKIKQNKAIFKWCLNGWKDLLYSWACYRDIIYAIPSC